MEISALDAVFIFCVSSASLYVFRKFARVAGLVDKPDVRKHHDGAIPLVGGVSICFTVVHYLYLNPFFLENNTLFILSISILTIVGALDDRFDVSFKLRLIVQSIVSLLMIQQSGIMLADLGNLIGTGSINLGWLGVPVTLLAVLGAINAFNMVDGIDGLLGGISLVTFGSFAYLMDWSGQVNKFYICILFMIAILPFILMNLGAVGKKRKVFMGDAGSMMIGFTIVWLLLGASQNDSVENSIRPVTCLWLIAVPLFDMVSIIIRRVSIGKSPFLPDRNHIHHILHRLDVGSIRTVIIICALSSVFALVGIIGETNRIAESYMFFLFIIGFVVYHIVTTKLVAISINKA